MAIGLNEAIALQQLHYWLENPKAGEERDGFKWIFNTYEEWKENFPFWSERTIQRIFLNLEEMGLVIACQLDKAKYERRKYYRIDYDKLATLDSANLARSLNDSETTAEKKEADEKPDFKNLLQKDYRTIPELKIFMDATGWMPGSFVLEMVYDFVHSGLTESEIKAAFKAWTGRGFKSNNVEGYLTWARDGIPAAYASKQPAAPRQRLPSGL